MLQAPLEQLEMSGGTAEREFNRPYMLPGRVVDILIQMSLKIPGLYQQSDLQLS